MADGFRDLGPVTLASGNMAFSHDSISRRRPEVPPSSACMHANKKNVPFIMAAHNIPYVATASIAYPSDLVGKLQYAKALRGFKYIHVQSPCPTGWGFDPSHTIKVARLMVETGIWPLYEISEGNIFKLNLKPRELKPVREALSLQSRFRHLDDSEYDYIQGQTVDRWRLLLGMDGNKLPM